MFRVHNTGWRLILAFLPAYFHKFFFKNANIEDGIEVSEDTKEIFETAEVLGYIQHPQIETFASVVLLSKTKLGDEEPQPAYTPDKDRIAVSYNDGRRFKSWSGLVKFLYDRHWQIVILIWTIVIFALGKFLGVFSWICENYDKTPFC